MTEDEGRRQDAQGAGLAARREYWRRIYEEHHEVIRCYFTRYVRHRHDIDDLMQTVFLNLMVRGGDVENPRAYLFAVARHELSFYWRRRKKSVLVARIVSGWAGEYADGAERWDRNSNPLIQLSHKEMHATVGSLVDSLSPALSEALRLRYFDGLRLKAAAARAGCSCLALKKRLERAKRSLTEGWQIGGG
jgi:RNA polymerase sigma factor (sigma-70 family)